MGKIIGFVGLLCAYALGFSQVKPYDASRLFSIEEQQKDFQFIRSKLEKSHVDLYFYTPKPMFDAFMDSLYNSITKPATAADFYHLVTLLNSKIKDGHTMFLPDEAATDYFNEKGKFLPLFVLIDKNRMYVNMNCSLDTALYDGAEILSVNNVTTANLTEQLIARQIRDGYSLTYPVWILSHYFKEYYSFSFGHPDSFIITFKNKQNAAQTITLHALPKDSIKLYKLAKYSSRLPATNDGQGITLKIDTAGVATLTVKSFEKSIIKNIYNQDFKSAIEKAFSTIAQNNIISLILDLRDNQGGDFQNGRTLLSYLVLEPVKYLYNSLESRNISPEKNGFKGSLYILINGGSFSNSGIVSSCLEFSKRGVFIGEETAGNKTVVYGNEATHILPATKIKALVTKTKYIIRESENDGHGVIPAHYVVPSITDIISNKDIVKEVALSLIRKEK